MVETESTMGRNTTEVSKSRLKELSEIVITLAVVFVLAMGFRSFLFEPFHIPSGSMKSTLLVGDYVFVSKYSYGYSRYSFPFGMKLFEGRKFFSEPERGDVIVFKLPSDNSTNYIKRLIGLPGDRIQMKFGRLYINGEIVERRRIVDFIDSDTDGSEIAIPQYIETLPNGVSYKVLDQYSNIAVDNTGVYQVPEGHYFFLGDNRDNSQDSRVVDAVGYVPLVNFIGKAQLIFFSSKGDQWKFWTWIE